MMSYEDFTYTTSIDIRFADLDAYGHVNNAIFFTYLEHARVKMFQEYFGAFLDSSLLFLVVRAECDYRLPITLNDNLLITLKVEQLRHSSFTFTYLLHDGDGREFANARTVMVGYDPQTKKPAALPAEIRQTFARYS
ncbi:MAG: thioesterase family protein [Pelovirga sp.]